MAVTKAQFGEYIGIEIGNLVGAAPERCSLVNVAWLNEVQLFPEIPGCGRPLQAT